MKIQEIDKHLCVDIFNDTYMGTIEWNTCGDYMTIAYGPKRIKVIRENLRMTEKAYAKL